MAVPPFGGKQAKPFGGKKAKPFAGAETADEEMAEDAMVKKTGSVKQAMKAAKKAPAKGKKG